MTISNQLYWKDNDPYCSLSPFLLLSQTYWNSTHIPLKNSTFNTNEKKIFTVICSSIKQTQKQQIYNRTCIKILVIVLPKSMTIKV